MLSIEGQSLNTDGGEKQEDASLPEKQFHCPLVTCFFIVDLLLVCEMGIIEYATAIAVISPLQKKKLKVAIINHFLITMHQMTVYSVKSVAALLSSMMSFS